MNRMNELAFYTLAGAPRTPRDLIDEVRKRQRLLVAAARGPLEQVEEREEQQNDDHPKRGVAAEVHGRDPCQCTHDAPSPTSGAVISA